MGNRNENGSEERVRGTHQQSCSAEVRLHLLRGMWSAGAGLVGRRTWGGVALREMAEQGGERMTWVVLIEFEDAQTAGMTITGVTKTLRETGHKYLRAALREVAAEGPEAVA